ncbi:hypothetical protein MGYG_04140 [Nannizzia gypsea CBS 118893]|uniref:F-box domain-containing protein n=1 Tax=Arthroderma gypseum (strain ATCC MYA-4604 / CBS 118893) TaxID=535722 RepID=E4UV19_ARTGP|nr:hypothetical protein MGYG_04140 [Nannizzia gypsea CBS 118893]EFR01136.1 hypothetical protein MGYG_04140 [Nannizzia gypsea CBS 118893]
MPSFMGWNYTRHRQAPRRRQAYRRTDHNTANSPLFRLPAELLAMVTKNLEDEDDRLALGYTCARFFYSDALKDTISDKEARFRALCMLELRREPWHGERQYCCRGCLAVHGSAAFFSIDLLKDPSERHCRMTVKCINLGIHGIFSFADIKKFVSQERGGRDTNWFTKIFSSPKVTLEFSLPIFPQGADVTPEGFNSLFKIIDYVLCPHMRAKKYVKSYLYCRKPGIEPRPGWIEPAVKCYICNTVVTLGDLPSSTPGNDGRVWLAINVSRPIGRLYSPLEQEWLNQSFSVMAGYIDWHNKIKVEWCRDYWRENPTAYVGWQWEKCLQGHRAQHQHSQTTSSIIFSETASKSNWHIMTWSDVANSVFNGINAVNGIIARWQEWRAQSLEEEERVAEGERQLLRERTEAAARDNALNVRERQATILQQQLEQRECNISQREAECRRLLATAAQSVRTANRLEESAEQAYIYLQQEVRQRRGERGRR